MKNWIVAVILGITPVFAFGSYAPSELLIKVKSDASARERADIDAAFAEIQAHIEKKYEIVPGLVKVRIPEGKSVESAVQRLSATPGVIYAEPNFIRRLPTDVTTMAQPEKKKDPAIPAPVTNRPDPTKFRHDPRFYSNWGVTRNQTDKVFDKYKFFGDPNTKIAILDTGVDYTHPDLKANIWRNPGESGLDANGKDKGTNGIDDDNNGYVDDVVGWDFRNKDALPFDDYGHGTHVAGIAAAVAGNGRGVVGHCPNCSIMVLKFIGSDGSGTDAEAIEGLQYAIKMHATVINSSWGGNEASQALFDAFKATSDAGILNAVAAGNDGKDLENWPMYPAKYRLPGLFTMAALYLNHSKLPFWSNWGSHWVHMTSAGADVTSTVPGGDYDTYSGTSMATPNMTGCLALIKSYRPSLTFEQITHLLKTNVLPDPGLGNTIFRGHPDMPGIFKKLQ